jgi:N-acetylmuramoyl-L-alanine amidase
MAGAGRRCIGHAGHRIAAGFRGLRAARQPRPAHAGWRGLALVFALCFVAPAQADEVVAARIWPAPEYTRLTLETKEALKYTLFTVKDPERLVLELETDEIAGPLTDLQNKLTVEDPYIKGLRVARNRPGIVRVVLDLKQTVNAQVFTLKPVGEYGFRLVLDLHPLVPVDPVSQLLAQQAQREVQPVEKPRPGPVQRLATIVIDAGHGGEDPGAIGRRGSREKDNTLMIARRLKALIDAEPNMRALLTRDGDYFLPLNVRVDKARAVKADLFVSIHADSFVRRDARGSSVFALSERRATSEMAKLLAKKENESDLIGGVALKGKDSYVTQTLLDLSQTATIDHSLRLGSSVLQRIGTVNDLHKPRVEQASFAVLKAHDVPSILIETAFISNPQEEKRLTSKAYQDKLAKAIREGIKDYLKRNPPRPASPLARN